MTFSTYWTIYNHNLSLKVVFLFQSFLVITVHVGKYMEIESELAFVLLISRSSILTEYYKKKERILHNNKITSK